MDRSGVDRRRGRGLILGRRAIRHNSGLQQKDHSCEPDESGSGAFEIHGHKIHDHKSSAGESGGAREIGEREIPRGFEIRAHLESARHIGCF